MYEVSFDDRAIAFLQKLERDVAKRIWDKIISMKINPHHYFERLTGRNEHKVRIGDYRAIADIDDANRTITILLIGHRKNIYKKR